MPEHIQNQIPPSFSKGGGRAMIIQTPRIKPKCPACESENVKFKLSFTTIVAWLGRILVHPANEYLCV